MAALVEVAEAMGTAAAEVAKAAVVDAKAEVWAVREATEADAPVAERRRSRCSRCRERSTRTATRGRHRRRFCCWVASSNCHSY